MLEIGRNDPCPCGSGKKYKKCCADKELQTPVFHTANKPASKPVSAEQMKTLKEAGAHLDAGDNATAIQLAMRIYREAPDNEDAMFIAGTALARIGQLGEGGALLEKAIALHPQMIRNYIVLAGVKHMLHDSPAMLDIMRRALALDPSAIVHQWVAFAAMVNGRLEEAETHFRAAIALSPAPNTEAMDLLYAVLKRAGKAAEAQEAWNKLLALEPHSTAKLTSLFMFPEIARDATHIAQIRGSIEKDIDELRQYPVAADTLDARLRMPPFYLAFHGVNDRQLLEKACAMFRRCSHELNYTASHCLNWKGAEDRPVRLGMVSEYFYSHSVGKYMNRLFTALRENGFEVHAFSFGGRQDAGKLELARNCNSFTDLPVTAALAKDVIAAKQLDILLYPDIGMNSFSYFLSFYRLAPVQCLLAGHPITSGVDTVDYYISTSLLEPENAQEHYSEKLLTLPHFTAWADKPTLPATWVGKKEIGFPERGHVYFCPMTIYKIHPDFDEGVKAVLERDPEGHAVFVIPDSETYRADQVRDRLVAKLGADLMRRVLFIPWLKPDAFFSALHHADVVIDSFHLGGGTTFYSIFAAGTPFVTLPGELMRGRIGLAMAKLLGIEDEAVATSVVDYAEKAVRLASDAKLREAVRGKILTNSESLFGNTGSSLELAELLKSLVKQPVPA
ncbi:MAG: SEC-C domain-containing protein [Alphaproteobacteria bacterium]|nr:SEC-C domain-containing protein [Alphaproteobacteria bacterium]